jgi:uncharacterized protein (TIGR02145 family)
MKIFTSLFSLIIFCSFSIYAQSVGIGTVVPATSAKLEVSSTNQGFLPPRMMYAQMNAIANPVAGLTVYCIDCDGIQVFDGGSWKNSAGVASAAQTVYPTIKICNQVWSGKNLTVSRYRNGDIIPEVTDPTAWAALTTGAWCWFLNDSVTYSKYGKLYNWYAATDPRGLAPLGWHVPSDADFNTLAGCVESDGGKLKQAGTSNWIAPNAGATNSSGFTSLPAGYRNAGGGFAQITGEAYMWSTTAVNATTGRITNLHYAFNLILNGGYNKALGASIRIVKD